MFLRSAAVRYLFRPACQSNQESLNNKICYLNSLEVTNLFFTSYNSLLTVTVTAKKFCQAVISMKMSQETGIFLYNHEIAYLPIKSNFVNIGVNSI